MSDAPQEFDLKFLPDWLKESPTTNRYADYQGESEDRPRRDRDDRGARGPRPERRGPPPPRRDGDRRGPGSGPRSDRPPGNRPGGPRPGGPGGRRDDHRDDRRRDDRPPREAPRPAPAALKVELIPEPIAGAGIARQIKTSGRAYAVFSTSKLFLERPERHRVRLTSADPAVPLFQVGDGPVSFDHALVERNAFFTARTEFYSEETVQGEPIKGNFSNVARARATGALLGPTNHHGYQPALRKLYEERFSRRMSFPEFQQTEIEIVTDEQAVADWKEQARTTTTYSTTKEPEPVLFKTLFDTEQHFRKHYLPQIVKSGQTLECSGQAARAGADRHVGAAVREAWEAESRFPQQIVNGLRPFLMDAGLHFFKHRKRVLFVSATKPQRHPAGQVFSDGVTAILQTVEASPRIKRPDLAVKILGEPQDTPEATARKAQLAADLHYLIHEGQVIEFSDGALELPLAPQDKPPQERPARNKPPEQKAAPSAPEPAPASGEEAPPTEAAAPLESPHEGESASEEESASGHTADPAPVEDSALTEPEASETQSSHEPHAEPPHAAADPIPPVTPAHADDTHAS